MVLAGGGVVKGVGYDRHQFISIEWFLKVADGPSLDGCIPGCRSVIPGDDDKW